MEQESDNCSGSTTSTAAIEEERIEESDICGEEFYSCGEDSQSSSSSCDSPWNFPHPPEYYREWDGRHVMEWNEIITYSDTPSSSSFTSSLSRSSSIMNENLDDSIKELSLELEKLFKAKDMVQRKLKEEKSTHNVAMIEIDDDVRSWFIHVDKSIKLGERLLKSKFYMKLLFWSKQQKKKVILELIKTIMELKNQAQDLLVRIARHPINKELKVQTSYFGLKERLVATDNFNKEIGRSLFGRVYEGVLQDGTIVAVKRLSTNSMQGEIANEIEMISTLQHPNIVKLLGCCIEGSELLIIYEYSKNNSLRHALFGQLGIAWDPYSLRPSLDWQRRRKISLDIARGLAYLHEESTLKIGHINIDATTILLDEHMDAKVCGFDLPRRDEHINPKLWGFDQPAPDGEKNNFLSLSFECLAPEYAWRGHLTVKADVYSYGVVLLEIVTGRRCIYEYEQESFNLIRFARALKDQGKLLDLVDPRMDSNFSLTEVEQMLNLALLCTNPSPTFRPTMTSVVSMIEEGIWNRLKP